MENFVISLIAGLIGCAVAGYALYKAFKQFTKVDNFIENNVRNPTITKYWRESSIGFWIILGTLFFTSIKIAQWIGEYVFGVQY